MIAYLASDLLWGTKIKLTAEAAGISARPVRSREMFQARLNDSEVRGLVLDLDSPEVAMELLDMVRSLHRPSGARNPLEKQEESGAPAARRIRVAAFGPHVETELLRKAGELGADLVLTRGAMERSLERVLRELDAE